NGIIVLPDFSTVLAMRPEHRGVILADMRRIYGGELRKEFGTAEKPESRRWQGRITCVVAATPDVDQHYSAFQTLGERFVMVRWSRAGGIEAALVAMSQDVDRARSDLVTAVDNMLGSLPDSQPLLSYAMPRRVAALT